MTFLPSFPARLGVKQAVGFCLILQTMLCFLGSNAALAAPPKGYYQVWADEFNGASLDTTKWDYWLPGNHRDAVNTANAVSLNGSNLVITTYTSGGVNYTAMLATEHHFRPRYGYYEASIQWGDTNGMWSAFWLRSPILGTWLSDPLDDGAEIDACEHRYIGIYNTNIANIVSCNIHWNGYGPNEQSSGSPNVGTGLATNFHAYSLLWTSNSYVLSVDGSTVWDGSSVTPPFGSDAYVILSSEVDDTSTTWAGTIPAGGYGSQTDSGVKMTVDYFRYYAPTNVLFWTGTSSPYWTNSLNWVSNWVPGSTSDLTISYLSTNLDSTLGRDFAIHGLIFLNTTNSISINGANTLSLGGGGIDMISADHNVTLNSPMTLTAAQRWTVGRNNPGNSLTVNGSVSGTTMLTKAGYGSLLLYGANTYSGVTTVEKGVLQIQAENNLGATLSTLVSNSIVLDHDLGFNPVVGGNTNNDYLRLQMTTAVTLSATRGIYLGNSLGYGGGIGAQNGKTLTINGPISGPGGLWVGGGTNGAGIGSIVLNNIGNTWSGGTYIVGGTLVLGANNVLPVGTPLWMGTSTSGSGTYFDMSGRNQTIGPLTGFAGASGPQIKNIGALTIIQTNNTVYNGAMAGSGSLTLDAHSTGTLILNGISGGAGLAYTGPTVINGGTLEINKANGLASTSITVSNGGVLKLDYNTAVPLTTALNLAGSPVGGTVNLNFTGTQTISALNFGATSMAHGTWGRLGSGALHEYAAFTGTGFLNVTSGGPAPAATILSGVSGTKLSYNFGAGSLFILLGTNNVTAPMSSWPRLATNGSTPGSFTIPTVSSQPQMFYRVKSE
jgi:autotransporter-associated beta strand protein